MLSRMKNRRQIDHAAITAPKTHFYVTGYLCSPVTKGIPAEYVYNGNTIRTSTVMQILEACETYITFETVNSIYTISYVRVPAEEYARCA